MDCLQLQGCDSGFGLLTTLKLETLGYQVVALCLTDKGVQELQAKVSSRVVVLKLDVTKPEDVKTVAAEIEERFPEGIYGLVNNAGVGLGGPVRLGFFSALMAGGTDENSSCQVEWMSLDMFKFVMDVNFFGYVSMVKALAPLLRRGYGRVVNIASVAGFAPATSTAAYAASKHAVEAFTDVLRMEMEPFGVAVTCIEPFFMKTNIIQGIDTHLTKLFDALVRHSCGVLIGFNFFFFFFLESSRRTSRAFGARSTQRSLLVRTTSSRPLQANLAKSSTTSFTRLNPSGPVYGTRRRRST